ncbi:MAG TPA: hypothetical protein VF529_09710 [Solirubrobacteraceae bacterium]|jgi:predicted transcriptional regulator
MTSFNELGQDARVALLALSKHRVLTRDQLAAAVRIEQFEHESAEAGLSELETAGLAARNGHLWELTSVGRQMAASVGDDDTPFIA